MSGEDNRETVLGVPTDKAGAWRLVLLIYTGWAAFGYFGKGSDEFVVAIGVGLVGLALLSARPTSSSAAGGRG